MSLFGKKKTETDPGEDKAGGLGGLFANPMIQNMFLGKAKSLIKEHGITAVIITPGDDGELKFQLEKEPIVILKQSEFDNMVNKISNG